MIRTMCAAIAAMVLGVTSAWAQLTGPPLLSVTVNPPAPTVAVGNDVMLTATGYFDDATTPTRQLAGGGAPPRWSVLFQPGINVEACTPPPTTQYCCQNFGVAPDGSFDETWAPNSPNTLRAVGQLNATAVTASLSCAQTGSQTGSISATWNGTYYAGTFTFANSGEVSIKGLTWSSSAPSIATVDPRGVVRGVAPGTATIIATYGSTCWAGSPEPPGGCAGSVAGTATVTVIAAGGPPGLPFQLRAQANGNVVGFLWNAPSTGPTPTGYTLVGRQSQGGPILATLDVGSGTEAIVTVPNGSYFATVRGRFESGPGAESDGVTITLPAPIVAPGAPENLQVGVNGRTATFSWNRPSDSPPPSGYRLLAALSPGGTPIASIAVPPSQTTLVVNDVPPGTYHVRVVALSPGPTGPPSNEVTVAVAVPLPPLAPTLNPAQVEGTTVMLSWTAAATGPAATSFVLAASVVEDGPLVAVLPIAGTSITVNAPRGRYFVRVAALNAAGQSAPSNQITVEVP